MVAQILSKPKPAVGVVSLDRLPGAGGWDGNLGRLITRAEQEALALASAGVDALLLENAQDAYGVTRDRAERLDPAAVSAMTRIAERLRQLTGCPLGIRALPNDPLSALAIALTVDAAFICAPVLIGARITESGMSAGALHALREYRQRLLGAESIAIVADVTMNHVVPTAQRMAPWRAPRAYLEQAALATARAGLADALLLQDLECAPEDIDALRQTLSEAGFAPALWLTLNEPQMGDCQREPDVAARLLASVDGLVLAREGLQKQGASEPIPVSGLACAERQAPAVDPFRAESLAQALHAARTRVCAASDRSEASALP
ncbi:MAG: hypothetical protein IPK79_07215 [Vampirovibrionales bacterium]|nr:hypothetical protein [Vampirovibrionales bacterium]